MNKRLIITGLGLVMVLSVSSTVAFSHAETFNPAAGFGTPMIISVANSGAVPRVAVSSRGNAVVVFTDVMTGTNQSHVYARQLVNGVWQAAQEVDFISQVNNHWPDIALSSDGNGVAVWTSTIVSGTDTYIFASRLIGGVWQSANYISAGTAQDLPPHVALSSDGNGLVVFSVGQDTYGVPLSAGLWQAPYKLSGSPPFGGIFPAIALSSDGNGLVVFNNSSAHVARRLINGVWQALENMDNCSAGFDLESRIALAYDGTGLVANGSCDQHGAVNVLAHNAFQSSLQLSLPVRAVAKVASAPDGSGQAVYGGADGRVHANRFSGSAWQGDTVIDGDLPSYNGASKPDIALTYYGNGAAVFYKADNVGAWHLFGKRRLHDVWQTSELIGSSGVPTNTYDAPRVAVAADGSAVVVFGENGHLYANTYFAPPSPVAQLNPRSLGFGSVHMGLTSDGQVITLNNVGSAPLTITNVSLTGANSGDFAVAPNRIGSVIAPHGSVTMSLTFAPTLTGTRTASLAIDDNAYDSPQTMPLNGLGAGAALISILQDSVCQGLVVNVHGKNFPYDPAHSLGSVRVSFDTTPIVTVTTGANGTFLATITIPPAAGGQHAISAVDINLPAAQDVITLPVPSANLPIVFIPGVSGSVLEANSGFTYKAPPDPSLFPIELGAFSPEQHTYAPGERLWLNGTGTTQALLGHSRYFDALRLQADGVTPLSDMNGTLPDLGVNGVLFDVPGLKYTDVYSGLRNFLITQGYTEGQTLFYFPYDWRKDLGPTASDLEAVINQALATSGQSKVVLIAHSMGGLVARNYVLHFGASKVEQIITLGTPFLGAPKVVKALEVGDDWGIGWHTAFDLGAGLHPNQLKKMAQNYPAAYELSPSQEWFNSRIDPDPDPRYILRSQLNGINLTTEPLDFNDTEGFLASRHNAGLLSRSEGFHNQPIGDFTLPGEFYFDQRIIGGDLPTLGHIAFTPRQATAQFCLSPLGPCWTVTVPLPESAILQMDMLGDGTVPLHSALGANRRSGDYRFYYLSGVNHMDLPLNSQAQFLIGEMLKGRMCSNQQNPFLTAVQSAAPNNEPLAVTAGTTATFASGTQILVVGNADLNLYDTLGRHTGPIAPMALGAENSIPGVGYESSGSAQVAMIAASGVYTIVLRGERPNGAAMLRLSAMDNGVITQTLAFEGIPITTTTVATLTLTTPGVPISPSFVTQFDAGWPVQSVGVLGVLTGTASQDITPPMTFITLDAGRNVTITAQDDPGGSGVLRIYYDTESTPLHYAEYTGTFQLPPGTSVTAFALDRAGNAGYPPAHYPYLVYLPVIRR